MAKIIERRRIHCAIKHEDSFVLRKEDGNVIVKCVHLKECSNSCPYLKDPDYTRPFRRLPKPGFVWVFNFSKIRGMIRRV